MGMKANGPSSGNNNQVGEATSGKANQSTRNSLGLLHPYMAGNAEGQFLRSLGTLVSVKASSEQTGGAFNLFEVTCLAGYTTSLHIHYTEDVAIYVLEGRLSFFWGNEKMEAIPGSYFYQPRGTPHGFRVEGGTPARILYMTIPAGLDRFVLEQGRQAQKNEVETDAARYKIEILGPLPE